MNKTIIVFSILALVLLSLPAIAASTATQSRNSLQNEKNRAISTIAQSALTSETKEQKVKDCSSTGLAKYFTANLKPSTVQQMNGSLVKVKFCAESNKCQMNTWNFYGDGSCTKPGNCYVKVKLHTGYMMKVPLVKNSKGYMNVVE